MGDGKGKSVIVGSRNSEDGWSTYQSATVGNNAVKSGFLCRTLPWGAGFIERANHHQRLRTIETQAVALRVGADHGVVYQCSIQGFQDSLYSYANRQFYRDCDIYGTVDFIFGNSASVFQNCITQARHPAGGQKNSITAQGRSDPNQNTGMSFQSCKVSGDSGGAPTYPAGRGSSIRGWYLWNRSWTGPSTRLVGNRGREASP
ncbi:hypothetical protein HPP92_005415 [Vanilla planifolia]|uniref:Pectinesterase n=1 Tax=Vanilla planifolia TaxID=51239 RepID=A0A835RLN6_VANPL|nr:hypothetical protein HPP92_005415 [Vanilla planifolia]